jgi:hypothetical protein
MRQRDQRRPDPGTTEQADRDQQWVRGDRRTGEQGGPTEPTPTPVGLGRNWLFPFMVLTHKTGMLAT